MSTAPSPSSPKATSALGWQKIARRIRVPLGLIFAALFLLLARPTVATLLIGLPFVLIGLATRAYAAGYLSKNKSLATTGPYAYTRNPLYLGSGLLAVGFALAGANWMVGVPLVLMFLAIYVPTIQSEERYLRAKFDGFDEYARAVPSLLPRLTPARLGGEKGAFSPSRYVYNREYQAALGAALLYAALVARMLVAS